MMYRQRMFARKIAIGKTADLIKSSTRMDVASLWERKALAAQNLEFFNGEDIAVQENHLFFCILGKRGI